MSKKAPRVDEPTPFVTGGDWSVGLNSPTSLSQAELMTMLGQGLQKLYEPVVEEGPPEHLAGLIAQLEQNRR